jgi:hypothetical protein
MHCLILFTSIKKERGEDSWNIKYFIFIFILKCYEFIKKCFLNTNFLIYILIFILSIEYIYIYFPSIYLFFISWNTKIKLNLTHPRGPGGVVRRALVAYEVWGSTPLFVCSRSLEEPLPPGTGISLGEAWDTLVHTKKKKLNLTQ